MIDWVVKYWNVALSVPPLVYTTRILKDESTLGHLPFVVFVIMLLSCAGLLSTYAYDTLKEPPTIFLEDAIGVSKVNVSSFDLEYYDAIGRRYLNLYGNWIPNTHYGNHYYASKMCTKELADHMIRIGSTYGENVSTWNESRKMDIESSNSEWYDDKIGNAQISYRVKIEEYASNTLGKTITGQFLIELVKVDPEEGGVYSAMISKAAFYPDKEDSTP